MNIVMINYLMGEIINQGTIVKNNEKICSSTMVNFKDGLNSLIKNESPSVDYNFIKNKPTFNNNSVVNDKLVNISNEDIITSLSEDFVDNVNKLMDIVAPLIKNSYEANNLKDDIIKAIKNKLKVVEGEDNNIDSTEDNSLNITNVKSNERLDKILYSAEMGVINDKFDSVDYNFINNRRMFNKNSPSNIYKLIAVSQKDIITNLSEELVDNVKKLIDRVSPLVKNSYNDNILKDDIITVIKNKLEFAEIEDKEGKFLNDTSLNIKNLKLNEELDKTSYSEEIGVVNNFIMELPIKERILKGKINAVDGNNFTFKDVIKHKNSDLNKFEYLNIGKATVEDNNVSKELQEKLEKISQSMKSNKEEEVIEEVVDILNLLNINIVNNSSLPIIVDMPKSEKQLIPLVENEYRVTNISEELVQEDLNFEEKYIDTTINLPQKSGENINKIIDQILPFIKGSNGEDILKDDIMQVVKKKVELVDIEDKELYTFNHNSLNALSTKQNNMLERTPYKVDGENYLNKVETDQLSNLNFKPKTVKELSKEDKILNKALGLETIDNFSQVMSRLNMRNDIQTEKTISSSTVFKDAMDEDIVKNVRFMIRNQVQELKVKIYPKELGEITIKILSEEGIMRAEIKATSKETYHLLHSNINDIKNSLSNENIKIQEVNIGIYNDDTTYYSGQGYQEGSYNGNDRYTGNGGDKGIKDYEEEIEEVINTDNSNVDLLV